MSLPTIIAACDFFEIDRDEFFGKHRWAPLVRARSAVIYVMRARDELSYPQIGKRIGDRDHSTVIHAMRRAEYNLAHDPEFASFVAAQMTLPKHSPRAILLQRMASDPAAVPPPVTAPVLTPVSLPPCPPRLVRLRPPPKPKPRYERYGDDCTSVFVDEEGVSRGERSFHQGVALASKALAAALKREHPGGYAG